MTRDELYSNIKRKKSFLCVGLDTERHIRLFLHKVGLVPVTAVSRLLDIQAKDRFLDLERVGPQTFGKESTRLLRVDSLSVQI